MAVYDDDEENPPVGFEQDPESDDIGDGYWTYADGSKKYASGDPADAKKLMKAAPPPPEDPGKYLGEQKGLGSQGPYSASAAAAIPAPAPLQGTSPIGPSADEEFLNSTTGAEADAEREAQAPTPEASEQPKPLQALTAPRMPGASGPARYTDSAGSSASQSASQSDQHSVSTTGSAQDRGEFEQGQQSIAGAYDQASGATRRGTQGVVQAIDQRARAMAQMGADKEAATAGAMAAQQARAEQVKRKIVEVGARKTDHNKIWKDKGIMGTTFGLLGVALRSLTATKFGGPNTALQHLQEQRKQNLQAQMEDRDSELRGLERELGSLDAAVPIFEARMRDAENKRIEGLLADEKSAALLANGQQMIAQNNQEKTKLLADGAKAYAGTIAKQQTQASQLSQQQGTEQSRQRLSGAGVGGEGGGQKRMTPREIAEADQAWEEQGVPPEKRARLWVENGYEAPTTKTAADYKREKEVHDQADKADDHEKKAVAAETSGKAFFERAGLVLNPDTKQWEVSKEGIVPPGFVESINPFDDDAIAASGEAAVEAFGRLQSDGAISKEERPAFRDQVGLNTANRQELAARANAIWPLVLQRQSRADRDAPRGPKGRPIKPGAAP